MSDSDEPRHRRQRSYDRDDRHRRKDGSRDRKRHRSRSPSVDRHDRHKRRPRSSSADHHESSRRDRSDRHDKRRREERTIEKDDDNYSRRRSRSRETKRKRRALSRDMRDVSNRHEEDRQLVRTNNRKNRSRGDHRPHRRSSSRSPPRRARDRGSASPPRQRARGPLPSQQDAFSANRSSTMDGPASVQEKQKPNYGTSGKLAAETNTVKIGGEAILLKYHEPPEARKPASSQAWRMYEFKGDNAEPLSTTELGSRSCWLFGRETAVVDFLIEHPSCSKQHAVIQFRYLEKRNEFGDKLGSVRPYVLDLESANGTIVNGERIPESRYMELKSGDSVGFGESSREYVILLPPKEKTTT